MSTQRDDEQDRPWQDVATELSKERDPVRLAELSDELAKALDKSKAELPHPGSMPPDEHGRP